MEYEWQHDSMGYLRTIPKNHGTGKSKMVKHVFFDWSHWFGLRNLSRPHRDLTGIDRIWGIIPIFPFLRSVNCHNLPSGNLQDKMSVMKTTFMVILKYENILDFITYFLGGVYTYIYIFIKCKTLCHILLWILVIYFGVLGMYWICIGYFL